MSTTVDLDSVGRTRHLNQEGLDTEAPAPPDSIAAYADLSRYNTPVTITAPKQSERADK